MLLGLAVALAAFVLFNPPLWRDPFGGSCRFLALNLHRGADPGLNISTQFFGQLYNLDHPLPWYNTLVWTAITVPVGLLLLAIVGAVHVVRQWRDPAGTLLLMHWLVLLVVRALPGTPPHDAERLILPSFAFLAALAGVGGYVLLSWRRSPGIGESISVACRTATPGRPAGQECPACIAKPTFIPSPVLGERVRPLQLAAVLSLYLGSATSLVWYAPQWLSYYNLLIGGLPGAAALGMEPTYYWDGLDREALDWLHAHTADDEKIAFASAPDDNLLLLQQWGLLRRATNAAAPGKFRWYVVQRRPGGMQPADRELVERARPAFRKTIRPGGRGPWRLDTPIVEVYAFPQGQRGAPEQSDGR
jgi:hypothetical protein